MKPPAGRRILLISFCGLLSAIAANAAPGEGSARSDSAVSEIKRLYEQGSYVPAELEGRRFLEYPDVSDSLRVQVEKYIAFSLIAQDKPQSAESHFWIILQRDSSFNLDPQLTSPKILSIFQKMRERYFAVRQLPSEPEHASSSPYAVTFRSVIFPGWEQLYQGRTNSGYALLSGGVLEVILTVYCDVQRRDARSSYLQASTKELATERYTKYNRYYIAEVYSAVAFGLTYFLSEVEVFALGHGEKQISGRISSLGNSPVFLLNIRF